MKNFIVTESKLRKIMVARIFWSFLIIVSTFIGLNSCSNRDKEGDIDVSKAKILVLATQHSILDSNKAEAELILEKLKEYKPDLIATEHTPYYDTLSLSKYYTKYYHKIKVLKITEGLSDTQILDSINYYQERSGKVISNEQLAKLARFYYLLGDPSNYQYYIFQLIKREDALSLVERNEVKKIVGEEVYDWTSKVLQKNEYGNIVFPLALSQNIKETTPVDHQARADSFVYWQKEQYKFLIEKYTKPVYDSIIEAYKENTKGDDSYKDMISLNTHKYIQDHPDFYWPIPGLEFDSLIVAKTLEPWDYRNKLAIKRLDSAIQKTGSKRAIITYGAMHAPPLIEILKNYPQYEVLLLEDL